MTGSNFGASGDNPVVSDREFDLLRQLNEARAELAPHKEGSQLLNCILIYGFSITVEDGDQTINKPPRVQIWTTKPPALPDPAYDGTPRLLSSDPDIRQAIKLAVLANHVDQNPHLDGIL